MEPQISDMTSKWFDETLSYMSKLSGRAGKADTLIAGCFLCGRKYCAGVFTLLKNEHKLPAAGMLRIMFELDVKLRWCLQTLDNEECFQRFRRWNYLSLTKNHKVFDELSGMSSGDEQRAAQRKVQELAGDIASLEAEGLKRLPDVAGICKDLSKRVHADFARVYARIYERFSWAIHVDFAIIQDMVHVREGQVECFDDPPRYCDEKEIACDCAAMACDVNTVVREHYGWDCSEMLQEFKAM